MVKTCLLPCNLEYVGYIHEGAIELCKFYFQNRMVATIDMTHSGSKVTIYMNDDETLMLDIENESIHFM